MAKIKSYTDLEQSRKLAKILSLESADMYYIAKPDSTNSNMIPSDMCIPRETYLDGQADGELCAWSLASLLSVLPDYTLQTNTDGAVFVVCDSNKPMVSDAYNNPIDACVAMVESLNELNLL